MSARVTRHASRVTMRLRWLGANACWAFTFGDQADVTSLRIVPVDGRRLYQHRRDAVAAAERCGLSVDAGGRCKCDAAATWALV